MSFEDLADRAIKITVPGVAVVPPPEVLGVVIRSERTILGWKVAALASLAGVSVSTIERIERGEKISDDALDGIAQAFGHGTGYYTRVRTPVAPRASDSGMPAMLAEAISLRVRPLRGEQVVRNIGRCQGFVISYANVDASYEAELDLLRNWCQWAGEVSDGQPGGRRPLYARLLEVIGVLHRSGLDLMAGTIAPEQIGVPNWRVAVICVAVRARDPGALKRTHVYVSPSLAGLTAAAGNTVIRLAQPTHD